MSRYLTPSKLCLAFLIKLYRTDVVLLTDRLTVLSFISSQIFHRSEDTAKDAAQSGMQGSASLQAIESTLSPLQSHFPGYSLYDAFLELMWNHRTPDDITSFLDASAVMDEVSGWPQKACSPVSPIGQFLRRCHLEYIRLHFSDAHLLFEDFVLFRKPSHSAWAKRHPELAHIQGEYGRYEDTTDKGERLSMTSDRYPMAVLHDHLARREGEMKGAAQSQDDFERMVHFQLDQLQTYGCRVPDEMKAQLQNMVQHSNTVPANVHFINFFDAWRSGAYTEAIDHLHRYFDYAIEGNGSTQNIKTYHQYALLHLAVLHADFGCYGEAIAAMNECIGTARENQDSRCLNFGLSWLVHLRRSHPEYAQHEAFSQGTAFAGDQSDILSFLQQKAAESRDWIQLSSALLAQAEAELQSGGNVTRAIELSYQSSQLNSKYALRSMEPTQIRLHGSIFGRLGQNALSEQGYKVFKHVYGRKASKPEVLNAICQQAYHRALSGHYDEALNTLMENDPRHLKTLRIDNIFIGFATMIRMRRAVHRYETFAGGRLLQQLRPMRETAEPDIVFETHVLEIEYLQRQGELYQAFEKIGQLIQDTKSRSNNDISHRIRLLVLKANVWARAGKPAKAFSIALRAASSAHRALLLPLLWDAVAALATIFMDLSEFEAARAIVDGIMPQALEGGSIYTIARLYSLLADAYAGLAGHTCEDGSKERDQNLNTALVYLERAREAYGQIEDYEGTLSCLSKKATMFRFRGEEALAEEMDGMYAAVVEEAEKRENAIYDVEA